jgi:hypothetical protein
MMHRFGRVGLGSVLMSIVLAASGLVGWGSEFGDLMAAFFDASDAAEQAGAIDDLVRFEVDATEIAGRLRIGRTYSDEVERGWSVHYSACIDDVPRPFHVLVPEDYDPAKRYPVLIDLHGSVNHAPYPVEGLISRRALWGPTAEAEGWILVMPHGDEGATWWSETGRANLLSQLAFLKRTYNVDENRVFLSGFSDGGSGALWMAAHDSTAWAGFVATYGHPRIAGNGPYQTYPRNLLNRPIRASNGSYDALYPAPEIELYIEQFLDLGIDIDWVAHPTVHSLDAVAYERPSVIALVDEIERDPFPARVIWETSDLAVGRCDWVVIDEISDVGNNVGFKDANVWPLKHEIRFGATFGYQGADAGFVVVGVEPWTIAHFSGVKRGDRIVRIDAYPVATGYEVPEIIDALNPGDPIEIEVVRDSETIVLDGQVTSIDPMYARDRMTGSIEAVADGNRIDVTVRNVARYTLLISGAQFDLARRIVVTTNGVETFSGIVEPDVRFLLEQAARDNDRHTVYEARVEIVVPPVE